MADKAVRGGHKNPLALARSQTSKRTSSEKKTNNGSSKAEQLWHKRSGGGLNLFVEYYCGQPEGVIVTKDGIKEGNDSLSDEVQSTTITTTSHGMSRAAQRRRRKKRKLNHADPEDDGHFPNSKLMTDSEPVPTIQPITFERFRLYDDQLLPIFKEHLQHNPHLKSKESSYYQAFFEVLSTPLPIAFRLRRNLSKVAELQRQTELQSFAAHVQPALYDATIFHAHQGLDKESLARTCPKLKKFLNEHSLDGSIARQELGSMLPVWLLGRIGVVEAACSKEGSKCRVLDMCASPGSKTLQIAELISPHGGTVRANDVHEARLQTLKDALQRSGVPCLEQVLKFANFDATRYPLPKNEGKKYSIVLCDVPCSGDGTSRKDPHIIPNWMPSIGNRLHTTQLNILLRALQCVQLNGVVSYSTCSLNPVEDEAVVSAALRRIQEVDQAMEFELLQISEIALDGLVLRHGVNNWRVADYLYEGNDNDSIEEEGHRPKLKWYETFEEAKSNEMADAQESLWPSTKNGYENPNHNLSRCCRLLPQDHDAGGFFVALIKRLQ
ncbi:Fmu Sun domain containing protein [Nitzschia inconspicua]|uniref:Fmu Sun domain containing protein n=1 Tax=Nitzschia inconspicua TaxID=303405 RepID=A0A9K3LHV1_9STRA|nr:Fmu Sun domain containing protein [Nitzschia inconspicua]